MKNIILIGMPGCGKSTIGVILAKTLGTAYIDTDLIIQVQQKNTLQRLIDANGIEKFLTFEEEALMFVEDKENAVIATGGSAVFSEKGMNHLKENGICVYLKVPIRILEKRLSNIKTRGIAAKNGETIADIYFERVPFYEKFADITIECKNRTMENIVGEIVEKAGGIFEE